MYRGRLRKDLEIWVDKGIIGPPAAEQMLAEYDSRQSTFSVGNVLLILAAVLISASILLLIAANWEAIPRFTRVVGIIVLLWAFHLAGAFAIGRGAPRVGAAFLLMGTMSFGGAISLIAQLYHLSGEAVDAMLLWFGMAALSAALFRSGVLTITAGFLSWAVFLTFLDQYDTRWDGFYSWTPIAAGIVLAALAVWTGASRVQHIIYIGLIVWLGWLYSFDESPRFALLLALCGMALFAAIGAKASPLSVVTRKTGAAPAFYAFVVAVMGLFLLNIEYDKGSGLAIVAIATVAASVLALALEGRDNGAVRYLAYITFAAEILYLSFVTIDSMLGTSGFFLLSGLIVAVLAFVVIRMEKLFAARPKEGSAS
ncbi:DUF2157 domain-containing protein [Rhizobium sp. CG5]|uniref:DUF2157 domain-containing protein n=1 Tax=Rhizobium sp. CG5 TaxID=2726076 RepID=UPI0020339ACA|nr:DUF2157 domain-containing protein [Rhizobium sp. CG5]MCM2472207.1 DUF2157 domain-containing protein [Rhizobium sp. CG5]